MNINEAIEKIEKGWGLSIVCDRDIIDIISQIDTQPKVVVPEFVAEWLEKYKEKGCRLSHALEHVFDDVELGLYIKQQEGDYTEIITKAWLDGYEVEKEQLYVVEIPDPNVDEYSIVLGRKEGKVQIKQTLSTTWWMNCSNQLTESEIKQDFEWAWQFAKPVEEEVE